MFLGVYGIDEYVTISAVTHRFSSGAAYAPTSLTYSIYEEGSTTGIDEDVDMTVASPFDAIVGCYYARRQLTIAAGFENNKTYVVVIKATVDSVSAIDVHIFQIRPQQTGDSYAPITNVTYGLSALSTRIPSALTANGNMKASLVEILTTALTETAGYLAAGFKKFFNIETPVLTVESANQTGDVYGKLPTNFEDMAIVETTGIVSANVVSQDNIDFGALQKASIKTQAQDGLATVSDVQSGLATPTNITAASGVALSTAGIKEIWDFLTVDVTATIASFANLFKTNIDAKISEAGGGGGLDAAGVRAAIGMSSANLDEQLETILLQISALGTGTGPVEKSYYVSANGSPCGDVLVIMSLDAQRESPIHKGMTDATGWVKFYPNVPSGTKVYMWSFKTGVDFNNPDEETV